MTATAKAHEKRDLRAMVFNIPNQLTWARLAVALVLFITLAYKLYLPSLVLLLVAAGTDWLDGYLARRWGMVTVLGRILDPFADKMVICGTFIFLAAIPHSQIAPWMAVVVVGRELLVTALRSFVEQQGGDFSAKMAGKLKMVLQCLAAALSLLLLHQVALRRVPPQDLALYWPTVVVVWTAIVLTLYSGAGYVRSAARSVLQA